MTWNWRTALSVILLITVILSGWSAWRQRAKPIAGSTNDTRSDYVLHDFELIVLDKQTGKESMTLRAPQMQRNRANQISQITTPLFLLPDNQGLQWTLRAKTGWLSSKGEELRLRGDVAGDSPKTDTVPVTTLRTQTLDVFPQQHLAKTTDPVTITRPGIMQSGVGMEVNLDTRQYKLLSQVKTRYEPNAAR